jgi:hypothetical protein
MAEWPFFFVTQGMLQARLVERGIVEVEMRLVRVVEPRTT